MDLKLIRQQYRDDGIFSDLVDDRGNLVAVTLEHSYLGQPKLSPGHYRCVRGEHELSSGPPFETFEVMGVPGHTGILFHQGNWNKDSEGCILLGEAIAQSDQGQMVTNSKAMLADFLKLQSGVDSFDLEVIA